MKTILNRLEDAVRVTIQHDINKTISNIISDTKKTNPGFNYNPTKNMSENFIGGKATENQLRLNFRDQKSDQTKGDKWNLEASLVLLPLAQALGVQSVLCHDAGGRVDYSYGAERALYIQAKSFYVGQNKIIQLPWLQCAKNLRFNSFQLGILFKILKEKYTQKLGNPVNPIIIDLCAPYKNSERTLKIYRADDLPQITDDQLTAFFDVYKQAHDQVRAMGINVGKERQDGPEDDLGMDNLFKD